MCCVNGYCKQNIARRIIDSRNGVFVNRCMHVYETNYFCSGLSIHMIILFAYLLNLQQKMSSVTHSTHCI